MTEGAWFAGVSASGTTVRVRHDAPEDVPPTKHDQRFWAGELRMNLAYGLSDSFAMEAQVPLRVTRTTVRFEPLGGGTLPAGYESIHHRNQTLQGLGDPRIGGRTGWGIGGATVSSVAGLTVPLGRIEKNPFELGDEGKKHQHIQFGTGTFNPYGNLFVRRTIGGYPIGVGVGVLLPWQENAYGYQAGIRANGGVQVSLPSWRRIEPGVRIDVAHEEAERWDGKVQQDGNLGRTDVLVAVSAGYPLGAYRVSLDVAVPVWTRIEKGHGQLEYPGVLGFGITRSFGTAAGAVAKP